MRRRPDSVRSLLLVFAALVAPARADESFEAFTNRFGLTSTQRTWQLDRLRRGGDASIKAEAARALSRDPALLSDDPTIPAADRAAILREIVAAIPAADPASGRIRLELARRSVGDAALCVDRLRAEPGDATAADQAKRSLQQARELLAPVLAAGSTRRSSDPRTAIHEGAELLEAWVRTQACWLVRHGMDAQRPVDLDLERAIVQFSRLVDAPGDTPRVAFASADLLRSEPGAEAAIGLANALDVKGLREEALAWLDAVETAAPPTLASRRVPAIRLALAIDAQDAKALRQALDRVPASSLPPMLAIAAARVAGAMPGDLGTEASARALATLDPSARAAWVERLAAQPGPMQALAKALRTAEARWPELSSGAMPSAEARTVADALRQTIAASPATVPGSLKGEALRLQAWCEFASNQGAAASGTFERAAGESASVRPECLWMAALSEPGSDPAGAARRLDLLRRQRALDPAGPYAGRVTTWMSRLDGFPSDATAVAALLEVPLDDAFVADARSEAARRLLSAPEEDPLLRAASARRALKALEPVAPHPQAARWRLTAALAAGDLGTAAQAERDLDAVSRLDAAVITDLLRLHVLQGGMDEARSVIAALPAASRASAGLQVVDALLAMQGAERRRAAVEIALVALEVTPERSADRPVILARLAHAVRMAADDGVGLPTPVAQAAARALEGAASPSTGLEMSCAEALRMAGRLPEAVERLQRISAGLPQGGAAWAEARWRLFEALRQLDPRRAAAMLQQHLTLAPDGGPSPWGARFLRAAKDRSP